MSAHTRMRRSPFGWVVLAVVVGLLALSGRTAGVLALFVLSSFARVVAVVLVLLAWSDERASGRAGLPPLAVVGAEVRGGWSR